MAKQNLFFEQGGPLTGDSGEREGAEGIASVKPIQDGESAKNATLARSTDNLRLRTEVLRTAGEDNLYLQDADMKWVIWSGNASGVSTGVAIPHILNWDPDGGIGGGGIFEIDEPMVLQPLNTPASDKQETKNYHFEDLPDTADIDFFPMPTKRAYNGANLIRVVWVEAPTAEIGGSGAPGWADAELSGDPEHIVTITVRDDAMTQISHVSAALSVLAPTLNAAGIDYSVSGILSVTIDYDNDFGASPLNPVDYFLSGTMEREMHRLLPSAFSDFFTTNDLADGDSISLQFEELVQPDPGDLGRRQRIVSNASGITHGSADIFKTSDYPERIPLAIPLCKRLGDVLIWLDGTIVTENSSGGSGQDFGSHGPTLDSLETLLSQNMARPVYVDVPLTVTPSYSYQLSGTYYVGTENAQGAGDKYFRLFRTDPRGTQWLYNKYPLNNASGGAVPPVLNLDAQVWNSTNTAHINPSTDGTGGYYTDPYIRLATPGGVYQAIDNSLLSNFSVLCFENSTLGALNPSSFADWMFYYSTAQIAGEEVSRSNATIVTLNDELLHWQISDIVEELSWRPKVNDDAAITGDRTYVRTGDLAGTYRSLKAKATAQKVVIPIISGRDLHHNRGEITATSGWYYKEDRDLSIGLWDEGWMLATYLANERHAFSLNPYIPEFAEIVEIELSIGLADPAYSITAELRLVPYGPQVMYQNEPTGTNGIFTTWDLTWEVDALKGLSLRNYIKSRYCEVLSNTADTLYVTDLHPFDAPPDGTTWDQYNGAVFDPSDSLGTGDPLLVSSTKVGGNPTRITLDLSALTPERERFKFLRSSGMDYQLRIISGPVTADTDPEPYRLHGITVTYNAPLI